MEAVTSTDIQAYAFAAYDMLLYLDTHPEDKKAFEMYKDLVKKWKESKTKYEMQSGPLWAFSDSGDSFDWYKSPWPWEKEANK